jgi:hypothetical protein
VGEPYDTVPGEEAAAGPLARRLFVAAVLIVLIALVCWLLLPRAGVHVPWWVPVLAFAVILVAAAARAGEPGTEDDEQPPESPDVAGRIG